MALGLGTAALAFLGYASPQFSAPGMVGFLVSPLPYSCRTTAIAARSLALTI